ncbi:MAG: efflux RND transporter periplasmic adaptor subunit [candidate division Zixibacteria bacterium]|nr:efflux RND transporter periplasmic adaptor subunit [candidate division Zixibacteria bacterium]
MPAVEVVQADYGSLPLSERLNGLVRAKNQVELFPQISAAVVQVYVQNGDRTKAGEPLVRLRDTELRERLKQAEASYQIAAAQAKQAEAELQRVQAELRRSSGLAEKDLISPTEFETAQTQAIAAEADAELARARVEQARATVDERQEALSRTVIRAPVDGTVGNRNAEVGMVVTPGNRLFTLGQLDSLTVEVVITDRMLSYIQKSQRTEVSSPAIPFGSLEAPLARISPFLHPVSHSTRAEIDFINPDGALNPGMFVTVDIFYGESEQATIVPLSALWENPATASVGVFVSRDSLTGEPVSGVDAPGGGSLTNPVSFAFIPVEVIARGRMSAGVRGVHPGNWVVTLGQDLLEGDSAQARARLVNWEWVERLQQLQREDLLDEIILRREKKAVDTSLIGAESSGREGRS